MQQPSDPSGVEYLVVFVYPSLSRGAVRGDGGVVLFDKTSIYHPPLSPFKGGNSVYFKANVFFTTSPFRRGEEGH